MDLDRSPDGAGLDGIDGILVGVEPHEACLRHRRRHLLEAVEGPSIGHEAGPLCREDLPDRLVGDLGARLDSGPGDDPLHQQVVELLHSRNPEPGTEQPVARRAHLVLALTLLPVRSRRTGSRIDQIIAAHLREASIERALIADEHRVHRDLHVVVDPRVHVPRQQTNARTWSSNTISWVSRGWPG